MKELELIEQYIEGKLTGNNLKIFEQRLEKSKRLRNKLENFQVAVKLIKIYNQK